MLFYLKGRSLILVKTSLIILMLAIPIDVSIANPRNKDIFPAIWNVAGPNEYFVGRKQILEQINGLFEQDKNLVALVGGSGIGKTQIAKKYAQLYGKNYDIIWWIDCEKNIDEQFKKLAIEWNESTPEHNQQIKVFKNTEEVAKQLKDKLRTTKLSWFLIFDNAADMDNIRPYLPEKHNDQNRGNCLVTSKNPFAWSKIMELDKFTRSESVELIEKITGKNEYDAANNLAEILDDLPLALVQAATYIKHNPSLSMKDYAALFSTNRQKLWNDKNNAIIKDVAFDNYRNTVFTTLSFIIKELEELSPESVDLLIFCSFLNEKNIPKTLIQYYLQGIGINDKLQQEKIISKLIEYSLIHLYERREEHVIDHLSEDFTDGLRSTFTIHHLTQLAIWDYLNESQRKEQLQKSLEAMARFLPDKLNWLIPLLEEVNFLLPHVNSLIDHANMLAPYNENALILKIRKLEYFLSGKRDFDHSKELISDIENQLKINDKNKLIAIRFYLMKAVYYAWRNYDCSSGIAETERALKLLDYLKRDTNSSYDEEYLMVYNRLIQFYSFSGNRKKALEYIAPGEELIRNSKEEFLGNKDTFYHSLTKTYLEDDQLDKAYDSSLMAIANIAKTKKTIVIGDLPTYIMAYEVLLRTNRIKDAHMKLSTLFHNTKEIIQDNDNVYMAYVMIYYGYASFLAGDRSQQHISMIKAGQEMVKRLHGDKYYKNRSVAISHMFLGDMNAESGENIAANNEYMLAEQILNNCYLGSSQADSSDIGDIYTKLAIINARLEEPKTAQNYLVKLQKNFGPNHRKTKQVIDYFIEHGLSIGFE